MTGQVKHLLVLLLLSSTLICAQDTSSVQQQKHRFLPNGCMAEFAGGFGMGSAGFLYSWSRGKELSISAGYVPVEYGNIYTVNVQYSKSIFPVKINKSITWFPLVGGVFANFNFGKNIYVKWPEYYPENYYWWNSSMRVGPFLETDIKLNPLNKKWSYALFFQCLTNDLYLYTYFPNTRFIDFDDILYYGAGIKVYLNPPR